MIIEFISDIDFPILCTTYLKNFISVPKEVKVTDPVVSLMWHPPK